MFDLDQAEKSGLQMLVNYHRLTGTSYKLWNSGIKLTDKYKIYSIFINILVLLVTCYFIYNTLEQIFSYHDEDSTLSLIVFIIYIIDYLGYAIAIFYLVILFFFRGGNILKFLFEQKITIDNCDEKKLSIIILILQILSPFILEGLFPISTLIFSGTENFDVKENMKMYAIFLVVENVEISFLALIAYYCLCMRKMISQIKGKFNSLGQFRRMTKQLLAIHRSVKQFDVYINFFMFIVIFHCSLGVTANIVIFYFDLGKKHGDATASIVVDTAMIFIVCYLSDLIPNSYKMIFDKFEQMEENHQGQLHQFSQYNRLYSMRQELNFTAFNLYRINIKTFMSIISLIISFSVVLIQTSKG